MKHPESFLPEIYQSPHDRNGGSSKERRNTPLTLDRLMEINHSTDVRRNLDEFDDNRLAGLLALKWVCGDSRFLRLAPTESFYYNTIANGGDPKRLERAVNSRAITHAEVVAHFNCGGRGVKQQLVDNGIDKVDEKNAVGFVSSEVGDSSILWAVRQALKLSELTETPIAAAVHDHQTGSKQYMAVINGETRERISNLPQEIWKLLELPDDQFEKINIGNIYNDHDVPLLLRSDIPEFLKGRMDRYEQKLAELKQRRPNLALESQSQNPRLVILSPDLRTEELWLPGEPSDAGNMFRLTTPRDRILKRNGVKETKLDQDDIALAWNQAEYAISHFSNVKQFMISVPEYADAIELAFGLAKRSFMHSWLEKEENSIIIAQTNSGIIRKLGEVAVRIKDGYLQKFELIDEIAE